MKQTMRPPSWAARSPGWRLPCSPECCCLRAACFWLRHRAQDPMRHDIHPRDLGAMASLIEDYAVIGNGETMALVGRDGSIDWLCLPRFDSAACFSALLGNPQHGRWLVAPATGACRATRSYRGDTMILETTFELKTGAVRVIDFMARREGISDLVRIVRGLRGKVAMRTELIVRFEYGSVLPWVSRRDDGRREIIAGPDRLLLSADVSLRGEDFRTVGNFEVAAGDEI